MTFNLEIKRTDEGGVNKHDHAVAIDPHGDGNTDIVNNHLHMVVNGEILPAGDDNHKHPDLDFPLKGQNSLV